jgi:hypothetical protein
MMASVDHAHASGADALLEPVLPQLPRFNGCMLGFTLQAGDDQGEDKNRRGAQD